MRGLICMTLVKFKQELEQINNPAIKKVGNYLLTREDIHKNLEKENKSLNEMWNYVISEAKRCAVDQCAALDDETVFGWAVHYYDEDDIKVKPIKEKVNVVANKVIKKEEKEEHKKEDLVEVEIKEVMKKAKKEPKKKKDVDENQISLFDFLG